MVAADCRSEPGRGNRPGEHCYDTGVAILRKKTTFYLDPELLRAVTVVAVSSGRHDYEIVEDAARQYLHTAQTEASRQELSDLLNQLSTRDTVSDEEALNVAYTELHAARRTRHKD